MIDLGQAVPGQPAGESSESSGYASGMVPIRAAQPTTVPRDAGIVPMYLPDHHSISLEWAGAEQCAGQGFLRRHRDGDAEYQDTMKSMAPNPSMRRSRRAEAREQQDMNVVEGAGKK